ncbi:N-acetylmuramoyl-L-alanine amidase [Streptomyces europaeiscabiei]|uniref:N-acetylmuramoyl-L-alanine amidase n=1 Tax=Streptomyces europaeiscabiei TaxID=146819 RepID=A0ABU4NQB2_9ACTN|nr:N-acetylmuramoyl-L-alanine amidase [Streptomyces europaeiscabiei]MDX3555274.1 N-acetylmuramoyl-L-alanine amidase [Streptomyces europaeiscabiei]MDX3705288.1 N-acetylmuramoyl-L-alanine amidase [Streptomyces europaeiscabiei]
MAWYPGATKYELQPESDSQAAIRPTQFIVHSIIAPWTAKRVYEYWRDSTNLESHFGLGYEGDLGQFIGTETRADANAGANRRADGTGAVSIETASNLQGSDPWTAAQVEELIRLGVWLHQRHGIPLRICRTHDDPGFGYHSMFSQWSTSGTACPGKARIEQFREVVFPGIVARATGQTEEDDMPTPAEVAKAVLTLDGVISVPGAPATNPTWTLSSVQTEILKRLDKANATLAAQSAAITSLAGQLGEDVDTAAVVAAVQQAIADAVVSVDVNVTTKES